MPVCSDVERATIDRRFIILASALAAALAAACATQSASPQAAAPEPAEGPVASVSTESGSAAAASVASAPSAAPSSVAPATSADAPADRSLNDIRAVVAQNREAFRGCYDRSAQAHPGIKGTFTLKFVLAPDGSVKSAEADPGKSQIHAPDLETCAIATLRTLKFPPSRRGMESTVSYPFDFNPKVGSTPGKAAGATKP